MAVVKEESPLLSARNRRNRLDLANGHKDWAAESRKVVILSYETETNRLGSDGRKWTHKLLGESVTTRLAQGTLEFGRGLLIICGCTSQAGNWKLQQD